MATIRRAERADADAISRIHVSSWQSAYRGQLTDEFLAGLSVERRLAFWATELTDPTLPLHQIWVAEDDGAICAFAGLGRCRDEDRQQSDQWELFAIYALETSWKRGMGRQLLATALESVPEGVGSISLWVLSSNTRARNFYDRMGFTRDGVEREEAVGGQAVTELRYVRDLLVDDDRRQ